jgi:hypothetical protein
VLLLSKCLKKSLEAKHIGRLASLPQFHLASNWDKEWFIVVPKVFTII